MFTGPLVERGDGLILYLDAANPKSYPGSGSTWFDISGRDNHVSNNGSVSTTTLGGSVAFNLDTNGKFFSGTLSGEMPSINATLEVWIYPGASELQADDRGCIILLSGTSGLYMSWNKVNQKMSNYWYDHSPEGYHETTSASSRSSWSHWCAVWNYSEGKINQWVNGTKTTANTIGTSSSGGSLLIGRENSNRQFSGGLAVVKIYNNALSDEKVLQNFNALRGRFRI